MLCYTKTGLQFYELVTKMLTIKSRGQTTEWNYFRTAEDKTIRQVTSCSNRTITEMWNSQGYGTHIFKINKDSLRLPCSKSGVYVVPYFYLILYFDEVAPHLISSGKGREILTNIRQLGYLGFERSSGEKLIHHTFEADFAEQTNAH